jgi:2',3'-cyclic-nucleotide 2'-phosphodiesterase (5'-nucleotidase family)
MYVLLALVAFVQQAVARPASPASDTVVLRVLAINDFHGALLQHLAGRPEPIVAPRDARLHRAGREGEESP